MSDQMISSVVTVLSAIVSLAIVAVLVSKNANTSNIIKSAGGSFAGALSAAEAPVTGGGLTASNMYSGVIE